MELQPVFHGHVLRTASLEEAVFGSQQIGLERQGGFRLVINVLDDIAHHLFEGIGHGHAVEVHAGRVCLHDGGMVVHVDDESGEVIAFPMHQTVRVVAGIANQAQGTAEVLGHLQTAHPVVMVDGFLAERQHTYGDTAYLEMSAGNELFLGGIDIDHLTFFRLSFHAGNGTGKDPGVKTLERFFLPGFEKYFLVAHLYGLSC